MAIDGSVMSTWQSDAGQMQQQQNYFDNSMLQGGNEIGKWISTTDKKIEDLNQRLVSTTTSSDEKKNIIKELEGLHNLRKELSKLSSKS